MAGSRINQTNNVARPTVTQAYAVQLINRVGASEPCATYRECRRNYAASIGRYATDGCREFLKAGKDGTLEAFLCAACGCHRSFHKKELLNRHQALQSSVHNVHVGEGSGMLREEKMMEMEMKMKKKAKRTKLTPEQKNQMRRFAEKLGWRPQKHDEEEIGKFCNEVGISRKIFKVWLCNNRRRTAEKCRVITDKNQATED